MSAGLAAAHLQVGSSRFEWRELKQDKKKRQSSLHACTPNRSISDLSNVCQTAHDQVGPAHRSRIASSQTPGMTNHDSSNDSSYSHGKVNVKKRKSFDDRDGDASPSSPSTLIQHLVLLPPAQEGKTFSFASDEQLEMHLEPLNAYLRSDNAAAAANPALANSMLLLDICDGTSSDGAESNGSGSSSSTSSTASGTKRSLQDSTVVVDRLKKRKLSHRIRSFLLLRPPGLPLVGTDGAADIQHILRAPAWLKNATSELSRESRMMPEEWMWTGQDTDHRSWTASSSVERRFAQSCRINANVVPSEQSSMDSQVQMHSVQLSLDEAEKEAEQGSLQPVLVAQRSRGGSAPPIMVAELDLSQTSKPDTECLQQEEEQSPRSPRHSSVPLPSIPVIEAPKPPAIPQSVLKAQLLAVLRKSLGTKASDAPLRMKKFVVWNAWMRRSKAGQRGAQGSGSSDDDMADDKPSTSSSTQPSSSSSRNKVLVTSPDGDDIEFLDLDEELEEPGADDTTSSSDQAQAEENEPQQRPPPAAVYVAPFSAEQIAAIQAVNRNRPTLKPASEVLQPITSIVTTPPPSPPSAKPTRPTYHRSASAGTPAAGTAVPRYTTRRSRSPPSSTSSSTSSTTQAGQPPSSSTGPNAMPKDYFAQVASSKASRNHSHQHSRSRSASGRASPTSGNGSGSDSSTTPGLVHSSSDGSSSDSSSDLRTPSPASHMELTLPSMSQKKERDLHAYYNDGSSEAPSSPKLRPRLYRRATYTS